MDFELPEELRMLRETVARFVKEELIPLEPVVIRREAERGLTDDPLIPHVDPSVFSTIGEHAPYAVFFDYLIARDLLRKGMPADRQ